MCEYVVSTDGREVERGVKVVRVRRRVVVPLLRAPASLVRVRVLRRRTCNRKHVASTGNTWRQAESTGNLYGELQSRDVNWCNATNYVFASTGRALLLSASWPWGEDTLKSNALLRRADLSCCCVTSLGQHQAAFALPQPLWEQLGRWNSSLHTNPAGRRNSTTGQHDAGCCVAGSLFPALL